MLKPTQSQKVSINKFNQMIAKGDLSFEEANCLCGHSDFHKISQYDRYGFQQRRVMCKKYGLIMSNPRLTEKSYELFYSTDLYRTIYEEDDFLDAAERRLSSDSGKHVFDNLSQTLAGAKDKKILELGCGGGRNLIHFFKAGYKVVGYDYSPSLIKIGKNYDLDLRKGTIQDIEDKYDIIILNHVIEHFVDLLGSMNNIIQHLNPKGRIYIGVPNIEIMVWVNCKMPTFFILHPEP